MAIAAATLVVLALGVHSVYVRVTTGHWTKSPVAAGDKAESKGVKASLFEVDCVGDSDICAVSFTLTNDTSDEIEVYDDDVVLTDKRGRHYPGSAVGDNGSGIGFHVSAGHDYVAMYLFDLNDGVAPDVLQIKLPNDGKLRLAVPQHFGGDDS